MKTFLYFVILLFWAINSSSQTTNPEDKNATINITAVDGNNHPRKGEIITLLSKKTNKEYSGITDSSGKLILIVPKGETYRTFQKTINRKTEYDEIAIPDSKGKMNATLSLQLTEIKETTTLPAKHFVLENVYFNTGSAVLKPESFPALNNLLEVMKLKPTMVIEIAGHTDDVGDDNSNLKLSQDRAESVRNYLVKNGIIPNRVTAKGYGETQPIADNSTPEGKAKNRRTEVRIIKD